MVGTSLSQTAARPAWEPRPTYATNEARAWVLDEDNNDIINEKVIDYDWRFSQK